MCGRFSRSSPPAVIAEELGCDVDPSLSATPRFNVCPTEDVLVMARGVEGPHVGMARLERPRVGLMRWGLVPWFARDAKAGPRAINARAETLATTRTFKEPFERRRCLVVADGFYEWRRVGDARQPWFFRLRSRRPFVMAGVWDRWKPASGAPLVSCAIVTCPANDTVAPVHDRMPVIVPADARAAWLAKNADPAVLPTLLRPYPDDEMEAYAVSPLVNSPKNDSAECIREITAPAS
jgi:putative SOS response-associated peptidase YedK